MTRGELKKNTKTQISGNVCLLFLCGLIVQLPSYLTIWNSLNYVIKDLFRSNIINLQVSLCNSSSIPYELVMSLLIIIIQPILNFALVKIYLKVSRGQSFSLKSFFKGIIDSNPIDKVVWLSILRSVFTFLWCLLLIIPGIIKGYSYSMAFYILADNPSMKAKKALKESERLMEGHKWQLFILDLSFIWWFLLVIVTFNIASIYVDPYYKATHANFYNHLKEDQQLI